jgi:prepilin-type N-terminal cleavage/methylation domain-containing protein
MERNLQGSGADAPALAAQEVAPIRKLDGDRLEAPPLAPHDEKDYAGEFYPVEKKHGPHGFSLVELIVVIGIVTLLIAFAMPALRYARMSAQTVKCAAQLREIGQALHAYASENHGSLPAWSDWHTWPPDIDGDTFGPAWTIELIPYIGKPDSPVYNCPSFPLAGKYRNYFLETQWCGRSGRSAMKLTDITMSGRFVLSGDTTNMSHYPKEPKDDDADPDDFGSGMLQWPWTGGSYMHLGGNNVLFDDGHVSLCSRFNPSEMTFNPHRVQNHDEVTPD